MTLAWARYWLDFTFEAITSRAHMLHKDTYLLRLSDDEGNVVAVGECGLFRGLSADDQPDYEHCLTQACRHWPRIDSTYSSIVMGLESLSLDWSPEAEVYNKEIPINGLVWMGSPEVMLRRIDDKIRQGYRCIKLKISARGLDDELALLRHIREAWPSQSLELRLDANGAFTPREALQCIERLARYDIHSLEQPIMAGQRAAMREICQRSPIPIALDEELIALHWDVAGQQRLLDDIQPQYIILKPTLCGGLRRSDTWIRYATQRGIGWWATSALESDIGLSAIAHWVARHHTAMPQGLGTGQLYSNNIAAPVRLRPGRGVYLQSGVGFSLPDNLQWHS